MLSEKWTERVKVHYDEDVNDKRGKKFLLSLSDGKFSKQSGSACAEAVLDNSPNC